MGSKEVAMPYKNRSGRPRADRGGFLFLMGRRESGIGSATESVDGLDGFGTGRVMDQAGLKGRV